MIISFITKENINETRTKKKTERVSESRKTISINKIGEKKLSHCIMKWMNESIE